jgi:hypothetical protein
MGDSEAALHLYGAVLSKNTSPQTKALLIEALEKLREDVGDDVMYSETLRELAEKLNGATSNVSEMPRVIEESPNPFYKKN